MDRYFDANGTAVAPTAPTASKGTYPTNGDVAAGVPASTPGAWWFHQVTEELRNAAIALGQTPDFKQTNQLATGLANVGNGVQKTGDTMSGNLKIANAAPWIIFDETDQTGVIGLWRVVADGGSFQIQKNTSTAHDLATISTPLYINNNNVAVFAASPHAPTQPATDSTVKLATTAHVKDAMLGGSSQTWKDVTSSRVVGTSYTNTTGRPIVVSVKISATNPNAGPPKVWGEVNGVTVAEAYIPYNAGPVEGSFNFIVPIGATYKLNRYVTVVSVDSWRELS